MDSTTSDFEATDQATTPSENVTSLIRQLKPDSLAYKMMEVAAKNSPAKRQEALAMMLRSKVEAVAKALVYVETQMD